MLDEGDRLDVLDGWRGISILSVLACHLLPLGPKAWQLNAAAGPFGMAIFFALSGFLITRALLHDNVRSFLIRRACRILPLAYAFFLIALTIEGRPLADYAAYYGFVMNYQHGLLSELTSPLWSLCIEVHFYLFVALLVALAGPRSLWLLPALALVVTAARVSVGAYGSIKTHLRVDEILAGATVALIHAAPAGAAVRGAIARVHPLAWVLLLFACSHQLGGPLMYLRPYASAAMVASTLWRPGPAPRLLTSRVLKYCADISYALYVFHPVLRVGWLGSGGKVELYLLKRPLGFVLLFAAAHLSTFQYERRWIAWGKKQARRIATGVARVRLDPA